VSFGEISGFSAMVGLQNRGEDKRHYLGS